MDDLKLLPQAERLLSGTISASMDETQTTVDVSNPPSAAKLPTYWEIEPDSSTYKELVRVIGVNSSTVTIERGLNNGGTGFPHASLSPYKQKITSLHWDKVVGAMESGYLTEDTSYTFTRVNTSSFKITAASVDRTAQYFAGRIVRLNGTVVTTVVSSSYSNPDTTVVVEDTTVPATITSIELAITTKGTNYVSERKATGAEINTGTEDAKIVTPKAIADSYLINGYNSLYRQALINGNFDVWQRGTSIVDFSSAKYTADRWTSYCNNTATTISRQDGTGVPGSQYCIRMQRTAGNTTEQAWTLNQGLETTDSIKLRGRKLTLSFYARAGANYSSTGGTMLSTIYSGKGTDQSPWSFTTDTSIGGQPNTLTTTWTKYTLTTTNVVASDITQLRVAFSFTQRGTAGAADYVEIAQVQLCAGDVALPFMPKSFEEELRACQRYYEKSYPYATAPGTNYNISSGSTNIQGANAGGPLYFQGQVAANTYRKYARETFKVQKRSATPTVAYYDMAGNLSKVTQSELNGLYVAHNISETYQGCEANDKVIMVQTAANLIGFSAHWTADSEL